MPKRSRRCWGSYPGSSQHAHAAGRGWTTNGNCHLGGVQGALCRVSGTSLGPDTSKKKKQKSPSFRPGNDLQRPFTFGRDHYYRGQGHKQLQLNNIKRFAGVSGNPRWGASPYLQYMFRSTALIPFESYD